MKKNYIAVIIIAVGAILIIGLAYIFFFYKYEAPEDTVLDDQTGQLPQSTTTPAVTTPRIGDAVTPTPRVRKQEMSEDDLKRMAGSFAERFGSYSNQSDFSNVEDLMIFMTSDMKEWAENFVNKSAVDGSDRSIYYGISTKAITEEVKEYNKSEGRAEIIVKTQRREATGTMTNTSAFYQDVIIAFEKQGGAWKVKSAIWQTK